MSPRKSPRIAIVFPRRPVVVTAWLVSLLVAGGAGWEASRVARSGQFVAWTPSESGEAPVPTAPSSGFEILRDDVGRRSPVGGDADPAAPGARRAGRVAEEIEPPSLEGLDAKSVERPAADREVEARPAPIEPEPVTTAVLERLLREPDGAAEGRHATVEVEPTREPVQAPARAPVDETLREAVAEAMPAAEPAFESGPLARAKQAERLADAGVDAEARKEAAALLADYLSHTALSTALVAGGASETSARLHTVRVAQLAGAESLSTELARQLKREYANVEEVLESIRGWRILTPRITSLDTPVVEGGAVVVSGTLENPDIGEIRSVYVEVEALDERGGVLTATRVRVRPKTLGPGDRGEFSIRLKTPDPKSVLSTRARVVEWESEILDAS